MKFARKMVLVDYKEFIESKSKPEHELDTSPKPLYGLNNDMIAILKDNFLSDSEKYNKYLNKLNRFLHLNKKKTIKNESNYEKENENYKVPVKKIKQEYKYQSTPKQENFEKYQATPKQENFEKYQSTSKQEEFEKNQSSSDSFDSDDYRELNETMKQIKQKHLASEKSIDESSEEENIFSTSPPPQLEHVGTPFQKHRVLRSDPPSVKVKELEKWKSFESINKTQKSKK
jgi:Coiled coil protein 84